MRFCFFLILAHSLCAWSPFVEPDGRTNGYRRGAGAYLVVPVHDNVFFQGLGGRFYDLWTGSAGLGYRTCHWGANAFLDVGSADAGNTFVQGGVGLEAFRGRWSAWANGYIPFTGSQLVSSRSEFFPIGNLLFKKQIACRQHPYTGFDLTLSRCQPVWGGSLWGYATYFYFSTQGTPTIQGPRFQLEYRFDIPRTLGAQLITRGEWEYNKVDDSYGSFYIGLRIPLGCSCCCPPPRVHRAESILVRTEERSNCATPLIGPLGQQLQLFTVSTAAEATTAETLSNPFDYIVVLNDVVPLATTFDLQEGQRLQGFGGSNQLTLRNGESTLTLTSNVGRGVFSIVGVPVVTLADGVLVSGIEVRDGTDGFSGTGISNVTVDNVIVRDATDDGFGLSTVDQINIRNTMITGVTDMGISGVSVSNGVFANLTIDTTGDDGISISGGPNFTLLNSSIGNAVSRGVSFSNLIDDIVVAGNTVFNISGGTNFGFRGDWSVPGDRIAGLVYNNTIRGIPFINTDTGLRWLTAAAATVEWRVINNRCIDLDFDGIVIGGPENAGIIMSEIVANNLVQNLDPASAQSGFQLGSRQRETAIYTDNLLINSGRIGITMSNIAQGATATSYRAVAERNWIVGTAEEGIRLISDMDGNAAHELTLALRDNTIIDAGEQGIAMIYGVFFPPPYTGMINVTLDRNRDLGSTSILPAYDLNSPTTFSGTYCLTMKQNNTDRGLAGDITLDFDGSVSALVTDFPNLSAINNGISVTDTSGTAITNNPSDCPLPGSPLFP